MRGKNLATAATSHRNSRFFIALFLIAVTTCGCSDTPSALAPPDVDPAKLAIDSMEKYDANADGVLAQDELQNVPSMKFSVDRIDANGDKKIDGAEIERFVQQQWLDRATGMVRVRCVVNLNGQPLDGASVSLEPESFMGGTVAPASGVSRGGSAVLDVSDEDRPHPNAHGVQVGLYLVRISKLVDGQEKLPAKYNTHTTLGCEVADRAEYMPGPIVFDLSTR